MSRKKLVETVANFSEGRDLIKVEEIVSPYRGKPGIRLLDYSTDEEMNRLVVTAVGEPEPLRRASVEAIGKAVSLIDMTQHEGSHPRIGSADVIPFIPVSGISMEDVIALSEEVAQEAAEQNLLPVYLYEKSAKNPARSQLSEIRKTQFEGLSEKMADPFWKPDYGPSAPHPTAGATVIGAREQYIYFNVNLDTANVETARKIALRLRNTGGGLRYVKAMGLYSEEHGTAQVSMSLTSLSGTAMYTAFEMVKMEARRYGATVTGSEIAGFIPQDALIESALYYLQIEDFDKGLIVEQNLSLDL